jgi:hypothetical protein
MLKPFQRVDWGPTPKALEASYRVASMMSYPSSQPWFLKKLWLRAPGQTPTIKPMLKRTNGFEAPGF